MMCYWLGARPPLHSLRVATCKHGTIPGNCAGQGVRATDHCRSREPTEVQHTTTWAMFTPSCPSTLPLPLCLPHHTRYAPLPPSFNLQCLGRMSTPCRTHPYSTIRLASISSHLILGRSCCVLLGVHVALEHQLGLSVSHIAGSRAISSCTRLYSYQ